MRWQAIFATLCSIAALILSFLCLFAGHKQGFMEDYSLLTVNTSAIGQGYVEDLITSDSDNPVADLWNEISEPIQELIDDGLESASIALGLEEFYSAHMMNYCEGNYTPTDKANITIEESDIKKNISNCSTTQGLFHFDPRAALQRGLNNSGVDVTLEDLQWPDAIDDAVNTIKGAYQAMFVLYCIAIAVIFLSVLASVAGILKTGRMVAMANIALAGIGFTAIILASAIVTAVIEIGGNAINKYGNPVSIEAKKGTKFMALTWAATALMLIASIFWVVEFFMGRKKQRQFHKSSV